MKKKENESGSKKNLPKLGPEQNKKKLQIRQDPSLVEELADAMNPTTGLNLKILEDEDLTKETMLLILGKDENKFGIIKERYRVIKKENDQLILEPYDEKGPESDREAIAQFIVQMNEKQIMDSALEMTKKALTRKPLKTLNRLKEAAKKGPAKLKTKVGCVYIQIENEEVLL